MLTIRSYGKLIVLTGIQILCLLPSYAQQGPKCGFDRTISTVMSTHPAFKETYDKVRSGERYSERAAMKTTASLDNPVIPVVFHIILTTNQLSSIRNTVGIEQRLDSQLSVINKDFNARNADSVLIPGGFKALFGNAGVSFGLAHTAPDGSPTPGYEVRITNLPGFDIEGGYGSGFGFSGAKYTAGGGADAWDPESYLNIWLINPLDDGKATNILGLAIPTYIAADNNGIGMMERGIVLHYGAFGKRVSPFDYYVKDSDGGRTLTHEIGHYFDLLHIWGDDNGKCPDTGGEDDGISDTPPQAYPSSGCSSYPKYDGCVKTGDGIMFMNYMDYSADRCLLLFTHDQVAKMKGTIQPGADVYPLTQHPWLLAYPDTTVSVAQNNYTVYPNPSEDRINVVFRNQPIGLKNILITDMAGRVVAAEEYEQQSGFYTFSMAAEQSGLYFVVLNFDSGKQVHKVFVR
ncbi:MAG: T9SS type A sorting domain-containing protein [Chitinophagales bacterium]|nr:T9SS type A sorting domain-containing protein [Chitinophagales bacterium]